MARQQSTEWRKRPNHGGLALGTEPIIPDGKMINEYIQRLWALREVDMTKATEMMVMTEPEM